MTKISIPVTINSYKQNGDLLRMGVPPCNNRNFPKFLPKLEICTYLGKYNAGSMVITIPGKSGVDFEIDGVSWTSIPR